MSFQKILEQEKNQEILDDILQNDPDSNVRILAIKYINSDVAIRDAALNDSTGKSERLQLKTLRHFLTMPLKIFG